MLESLTKAHRAGRLQFFAKLQPLHNHRAFEDYLRPLRTRKWYVDARVPFAGPQAVLAYLSRYTHRVAIANSRLLDFDGHRVTFLWKDYRAEEHDRYKAMSLQTHEFIRRFLLHVLPSGFHRIRHYGLFANGQRRENLIKARRLLDVHAPHPPQDEPEDDDAEPAENLCPACGAVMEVIEIFMPPPRHRGGDPP